MDSDGGASGITYDMAWFGRSDMVGAGLCSNGAQEAPATACTAYRDNSGLLISTDELKASFLEKGYTSVNAGEPKYTASGLHYLWINKTAATDDNSIYLCYVPKAKSNRIQKNSLWKPIVVGGVMTGLERTVDADYVAGVPIDDYTFETPDTSMFKCVP